MVRSGAYVRGTTFNEVVAEHVRRSGVVDQSRGTATQKWCRFEVLIELCEELEQSLRGLKLFAKISCQ